MHQLHGKTTVRLHRGDDIFGAKRAQYRRQTRTTKYDPATDGVMIVRYMMGLRNPRVAAGLLGTDAARTPADIDAYLAGLMP